MFIKNLRQSEQRIRKILRAKPTAKSGSAAGIVDEMLKKRKKILALASKKATPMYLIDQDALTQAIFEFSSAFQQFLPDCSPYYAVKANHHPFILKTVLKHGYGLDVSSGRELELALEQKAKDILFSGPGKTEQELKYALDHRDVVTINIDSFGELRKLSALAKKSTQPVRVGVRIHSQAHGTWNKFGIPLSELKKFWVEAERHPALRLQGIQFHLSWNRNATKYKQVLEELGTYLKKEFTPPMHQSIHFIDFGGGFYPPGTEGLYPWTAHYPGMLPAGAIARLANAYFGEETEFSTKYSIPLSESLNHFARDIAQAIKRHIRPSLPNCVYYTEPGRIICTKAMHIVLRVVDRKRSDAAITDGGVNMAGWEYGEHFYYPILNLSHPSKKEKKYTLYGSLCTPHDIWGYYCYASAMHDGDVILVPNQGAYRYSLAQNFIKAIPEVYVLK